MTKTNSSQSHLRLVSAAEADEAPVVHEKPALITEIPPHLAAKHVGQLSVANEVIDGLPWDQPEIEHGDA